VRIAILTHGISPFGFSYAQGFRAAGHEARVFSLTPVSEEACPEPVTVLGPEDFRPWETPSRWRYVQVILPLRRAMRAYEPDVVFGVYLSSGGTMACLSGIRHVVPSAQGSDVNERVGSRLWRRAYRWLARRSMVVHAVSEPLADKLQRAFGIPRSRIVVAPIGVDTAGLPYMEPAGRPNAGCIICTRAHKPVYDQATALRALGRLKARGVACRMTFVDHTEAERTKAMVNDMDLGDRVDFRPPYTYDELPDVLAKADVYVSASKSDGTSLSLLEALSTGTFPVVSDIEANRPWVTHGETGLLFPMGDDAALADCLDRALGDEALRASAAPKLRRLAVERGDLYNEATKLLAAFQTHLDAEV